MKSQSPIDQTAKVVARAEKADQSTFKRKDDRNSKEQGHEDPFAGPVIIENGIDHDSTKNEINKLKTDQVSEERTVKVEEHEEMAHSSGSEPSQWPSETEEDSDMVNSSSDDDDDEDDGFGNSDDSNVDQDDVVDLVGEQSILEVAERMQAEPLDPT